LGEMGLGEMGMGEMGQNRLIVSISNKLSQELYLYQYNT